MSSTTTTTYVGQIPGARSLWYWALRDGDGKIVAQGTGADEAEARLLAESWQRSQPAAPSAEAVPSLLDEVVEATKPAPKAGPKADAPERESKKKHLSAVEARRIVSAFFGESHRGRPKPDVVAGLVLLGPLCGPWGWDAVKIAGFFKLRLDVVRRYIENLRANDIISEQGSWNCDWPAAFVDEPHGEDDWKGWMMDFILCTLAAMGKIRRIKRDDGGWWEAVKDETAA